METEKSISMWLAAFDSVNNFQTQKFTLVFGVTSQGTIGLFKNFHKSIQNMTFALLTAITFFGSMTQVHEHAHFCILITTMSKFPKYPKSILIRTDKITTLKCLKSCLYRISMFIMYA